MVGPSRRFEMDSVCLLHSHTRLARADRAACCERAYVFFELKYFTVTVSIMAVRLRTSIRYLPTRRSNAGTLRETKRYQDAVAQLKARRNIKENKNKSKAMCRICFGGKEDENELGRLISPCLCKGSMRYVHQYCLHQWRNTSSNKKSFYQCDQCKYK